jgi:hypothetical protein
VRRSAALILASFAAACATVPPPVPLREQEALRIVEAWEKRRADAFAPRRLKALFRGEAAPKIGTVVRGYLSIFWDGTTLVWKASAPLAGNAREGRLRRGGGAAGEASPFPGRLTQDDALGALLGVLDLSARGRPVEKIGEEIRLKLDDGGREAFLAPDGQVKALRFPGGTLVTLEAASPFPLRLKAKGPAGSADLVLESWAKWSEGESTPGGGA